MAVERSEGGGAGRPSKHYRAHEDQVTLSVPVKTDDLVLTMLGGRWPACRRPTPRRWPRRSASSTAGPWPPACGGRRAALVPAALHAVADALTAHGFAAHTEQRGNELRIVNNHCPFGAAAIEHPVICAVDRGW